MTELPTRVKVDFTRCLLPLTLSLLVLSTVSLAFAQESPISDTARAHFNAGVEALQQEGAPDYRKAYEEFLLAYEDSPHWKMLGNLAIAAMKLERDGEAFEAINQYLLEGGPNLTEDERATLEQDLETIQKSVAWVTLEGAAGMSIHDTRTPSHGPLVKNEYRARGALIRLGLRAGQHVLIATLPDGRSTSLQLVLDPGAEVTRKLTFSEPVEDEPGAKTAVEPVHDSEPAPTKAVRPVPVSVYAAAGVTGALGATAGVFGILALSRKSTYEDMNDGTHFQEASDSRDGVKTLALTSDVLWGATAVGAIVTAVLYVKRPTLTGERARRISVQPTLAGHSGGVIVTGAF